MQFFVRTNNSIEGYNNRLRNKMRFQNPSPGYAISVLLREEDSYKRVSMNIMSAKVAKFEGPSHLDEITMNMPVDLALKQILSAFTREEQRKLIAVLDEEEFDRKANVTLENLKTFSERIKVCVFEEDMEELQEVDLRYYAFL